MNIYKLENGKIVEHWDVIQPVPEKSANNQHDVLVFASICSGTSNVAYWQVDITACPANVRFQGE